MDVSGLGHAHACMALTTNIHGSLDYELDSRGTQGHIFESYSDTRAAASKRSTCVPGGKANAALWGMGLPSQIRVQKISDGGNATLGHGKHLSGGTTSQEFIGGDPGEE